MLKVLSRVKRSLLTIPDNDPTTQPDKAWASKLPPDAVVFTDWEAVAITPCMWDPLYCIVAGMSVAMRRAHGEALLKYYMDELELALRRSRGNPTMPSRDYLLKQSKLMAVVRHWYGFALTEIGAVGANHGNSQEDTDEWTDRVREAVLDATNDAETMEKDLAVNVSVIHTLRRDVTTRLVTAKSTAASASTSSS